MILLPAQVIFLVILYRARVLEISPFSLEKTVAFYATADHATLDVCLPVWVKLFSCFFSMKYLSVLGADFFYIVVLVVLVGYLQAWPKI